MTRADRPVRLEPTRAWRTYLGGRLLDALHGGAEEDGHFPEAWIGSVVRARNPGREAVPDEGLTRLYGTPETLAHWLEADPAARLGQRHAARYGAQPGVLLKLIDAAERLTVQVHPDRATAQALFHSPYGKTECWYILDGRTLDGEPPCLYLGFVPGVTRTRWEALFAAQDIPGMLACLHRMEARPGDTWLIEGGVPHAIGAGCFLMEIQEPTDFTLRVERTTPSGFPVAEALCHQGLGFARMFDCFHYEPLSRAQAEARWRIPPLVVDRQPGGSVTTLIGPPRTTLFALRRLDVQTELVLPCEPRFSLFYVLRGQGALLCDGDAQPLTPGDSYWNPAQVRELKLTAAPGQPLCVMQCFGQEPQG